MRMLEACHAVAGGVPCGCWRRATPVSEVRQPASRLCKLIFRFISLSLSQRPILLSLSLSLTHTLSLSMHE